jgi:ribosomal protein S18 acetylase RimI-like enzyme
MTMDVADRVRIEPAAENDSEELALISKRAFETDVDVGAPDLGGPPGYDSPEFQSWAMGVMEYNRIKLDDDLVGGLIANTRAGDHGVMERIFVDPERHRMGIGTRAMELLLGLHPEVRVWTLGTPEWNTRTKGFYEGLGFVQVGWDLGDEAWRGRWYQRVMGDEPYEFKPIGGLRDGMSGVTVEGEVLEKGTARSVKSKRRRWETLTVANAGLGDASGRVVLVLWNEQIRKVKVGDRLRIENGYVSSYMGVTQLNVGRSGRLIDLI